MIIHHSDSVASAFPVAVSYPKLAPKTRSELWASPAKALKARSCIFAIHSPVKKKNYCWFAKVAEICSPFFFFSFFSVMVWVALFIWFLFWSVWLRILQSRVDRDAGCFPLAHEHICVGQRLLGRLELSHMLWCSVTLIAVEAASEMISATYSDVFVKLCGVDPREQSVWISQEMVTSE